MRELTTATTLWCQPRRFAAGSAAARVQRRASKPGAQHHEPRSGAACVSSRGRWSDHQPKARCHRSGEHHGSSAGNARPFRWHQCDRQQRGLHADGDLDQPFMPSRGSDAAGAPPPPDANPEPDAARRSKSACGTMKKPVARATGFSIFPGCGPVEEASVLRPRLSAAAARRNASAHRQHHECRGGRNREEALAEMQTDASAQFLGCFDVESEMLAVVET